MRFRKLRIAWSVAWGVVAVLLIVLWVRSYWRWDEVGGRTGIHTAFVFFSWQARIEWYTWPMDDPLPFSIGTYTDADHLNFANPHKHLGIPNWLDFSYINNGREFVLAAPHCFVALIAAMISVAPWIRWSKRFRLHTLLIAMTLVAVILGAIVIAVK